MHKHTHTTLCTKVLATTCQTPATPDTNFTLIKQFFFPCISRSNDCTFQHRYPVSAWHSTCWKLILSSSSQEKCLTPCSASPAATCGPTSLHLSDVFDSSPSFARMFWNLSLSYYFFLCETLYFCCLLSVFSDSSLVQILLSSPLGSCDSLPACHAPSPGHLV